jgi:hypothetical protein
MIRFASALAALALSAGAWAQLPPVVSMQSAPGAPQRLNPAIPSPEQVLGWRIGERHSAIRDVEKYFRAVAQASDRVILEQHGESIGRRPLLHAIISSPANLARLKEIQADSRRLLLQPTLVRDDELAAMKTVVWMGYGVHGNEHSATEAAIPVLHQLAAGQDESVLAILDKTVIILLPSMNPDGRDRSVDWMNGVRGMTATNDLQDREHREPWPAGRTNHYGFDLNRDWMPLTQPESEQRHKVWTAWRPQLTLDFHEMGSDSTFFFQPGVPDRVNRWTDPANQELTRAIGLRHAEAFETAGELYFAEERYDDFYIGKGSTYPDVAGSVGILFEQASSRSLMRPTSRGMLTFDRTVKNQVTATWSSLRGVIELGTELKKRQRSAGLEGLTDRVEAGWKALRWTAAAHEDDKRRLAALLLKHEIQVYTRVNGDGREFMVPSAQPLARLVAAMFDRPFTFDDDEFYDISAWPLDLAHGFEAERLGAAPEMGGWTAARPEDCAPVSLPSAPDANPAAWVIPWGRVGSAKALLALQQAGVTVSVATDRLELAAGRFVEPGDLVVAAENNAERLAPLVAEHARGLGYWTVGRSPAFIRSLGGSRVSATTAPRLAMAYGPGVSVNEAGAIWSYLDREIGLPVSVVEPDVLASGDLSRYSVILLASGSYSRALADLLGPWMRAGGVLICTGSAMDWASSSGLWDLRARRPSPKVDGLPYGEISEERGRHSIPGSIFAADLDTTHPLAWGSPGRIWTFRESSTFYDVPSQAGSVVARYSEKPLTAGYASAEALANAPGRAAILARREGRGSLILMADEPNFRAFWRSPNQILLNAIFFGRQF